MPSRRAAVAIAIAVAVALSAVLLAASTHRKSLAEEPPSAGSALKLYVLAPFGIRAYISEEASKHVNVSDFELLGVGVSLFRFPGVPRIGDGSIIVLHVDDFRESEPAEALTKLAEATANAGRFVIMILNTAGNAEATGTALDVLLKLYELRGIAPILPLDPGSISEDKLATPTIHRAVYSAEALVFTFNPVGVVVVESLKDLPQTLVMVAKWGSLVPPEALPPTVVGVSTISPGSRWSFIGYIGWITANFAGSLCGEVTGTMYIKVDYYSSATTPSGKTYRGFMAHAEHSSKGYTTRCCRWGILCSTYSRYLQTFISKTDWKTSLYPGQVLDDWGPKNVGAVAMIVYGVSFLGSAPATVQYGTPTLETQANDLYYEWYDLTDPANGVAATKHVLQVPQRFDISKLSGVLLTVGPTSTAFLDPDKPGGVLPMIVSHEFTTTLNTGETATISFAASLYPTGVAQS